MVRSRARLIPVVCAALFCGTCGAEGPDPTAMRAPLVEPLVESEQPAQPEPVQWSLPAADTAYLWDLEHHGNILVSHGLSALATAVGARDTDALAGLFSDSFHGSFQANAEELAVRGEGHFAGRRERAGDAAEELSSDEITAHLIGMRDVFAEPPQVAWGVQHITPGDRDDLDVPWTALFLCRMWGAHAEHGGPAEIRVLFEAEFERPSKAHMTESGWLRALDILEVSVVISSRFLFEEASARHGIDPRWFHDNWRSPNVNPVPGSVYALDFDRDHCVDLLTTDQLSRGNLLLKGRPGGGFDDVTAAVGLTELQVHPCLDIAVADLDGDGWEDLVLSNGEVYANAAGARFERVTGRSNFLALGVIVDKRATITVTDFDRDGQLDLYVVRGGGFPTSWLEDAGDSPHRNVLLRNLGNWQFEDVTEAMDIDGGPRSSFTAAWFDANGDLWPDCYVINEFGDGALYVNEDGERFREIDPDPSTDDFGSMGVVTGDVDNDGHTDVYVASMFSKAGSRVIGNLPPEAYPDHVDARLRRLISGSEFYRNRGALRFEAQAEALRIHAVGWAWGPSLADFDNDGWLDLYSPAGYISRDRAKPDG